MSLRVETAANPSAPADGAAGPDAGTGALTDTSYSGSRHKVDELFMHWLSLPSTSDLIHRVIDDVRAGKPLDLGASINSATSAATAHGVNRGRRHLSPLPRSPTKQPFSYGFSSLSHDREATGANGNGSVSSSSSTNSSSPSSPAQRLMRSAGAAFDEPADIKLGTPPEGTIGADDAVRTNLAASLGAAAGSGDADEASGSDAAAPAAGGSDAAAETPAAAGAGEDERKEQKKAQTASPADAAVVADAGTIDDAGPGAAAGHAAKDAAVGAAAAAGKGEDEGKGIPQFYFPHPQRSSLDPPPPSLRLAACQGHVDAEFAAAGPRGLRQRQFARLTKLACGLPTLFSAVLFTRVRAWCRRHGVEAEEGEGKWDESKEEVKLPGEEEDRDSARVTKRQFLAFWAAEMEDYDLSDRLYRLVRPLDRDYIAPQDWYPFLEELLAHHPGLEFLDATPEFQEKYARTVIARIFVVADRRRCGRLRASDVRHARLVDAFTHADEEEDINLVNRYLSYEHFYVLYCKFWELDADHDFVISKTDFARHNAHALSQKAVDRVLACMPYAPDCSLTMDDARRDREEAGYKAVPSTGEPLCARPEAKHAARARREKGQMTYEEFCYFLLWDEDKTNAASLRFWFSVADVDGDGLLRPTEIRYFYEEQSARLEALRQEAIAFEDVACQMFDLLKPRDPQAIRLRDFLDPGRRRVSGALFDVLFSLPKLLAFEGRDPFQMRQERVEPHLTAWDRYARAEYARLAMEEECREEEASMEMDQLEEGPQFDLDGADDDDDDGGADARGDGGGVRLGGDGELNAWN